MKGGFSETRIEKRIIITGDEDVDQDQVQGWEKYFQGTAQYPVPPIMVTYGGYPSKQRRCPPLADPQEGTLNGDRKIPTLVLVL